jgi:hypothetical protein
MQLHFLAVWVKGTGRGSKRTREHAQGQCDSYDTVMIVYEENEYSSQLPTYL